MQNARDFPDIQAVLAHVWSMAIPRTITQVGTMPFLHERVRLQKVIHTQRFNHNQLTTTPRLPDEAILVLKGVFGKYIPHYYGDEIRMSFYESYCYTKGMNVFATVIHSFVFDTYITKSLFSLVFYNTQYFVFCVTTASLKRSRYFSMHQSLSHLSGYMVYACIL